MGDMGERHGDRSWREGYGDTSGDTSWISGSGYNYRKAGTGLAVRQDEAGSAAGRPRVQPVGIKATRYDPPRRLIDQVLFGHDGDGRKVRKRVQAVRVNPLFSVEIAIEGDSVESVPDEALQLPQLEGLELLPGEGSRHHQAPDREGSPPHADTI
jgi:hypothetical protein